MNDKGKGVRFLGVDYGSRRIGLAVSDPDGRIASPLSTLTSKKSTTELVQAILDEIKKHYDIDEFVVGLPLNMDGSEGRQAQETKRFAEELRRCSDRPVHLWDERLSSWTAEASLREAGLSRGKRKARLDRVAAQVILQSFLDHQQRMKDDG